MTVFFIPALACSISRGEGEPAAAGTSSLETTATPIPTATQPAVVEDLEKIRPETETPEPAAPPTTQSTASNLADTIALPESSPSLAVSNDNNADDENDKANENQTGDAITVQRTATINPSPTSTATATATLTPSPTATPSPIALVGGWPPILPDASNINTGEGYAVYQTAADTATINDFYRRELTAQGWAELDFNALLAQTGSDISQMGPVLNRGGTFLTFSQDGGDTLLFVVVSDFGVEIVWPPQ